jgi:hypothetical protein
MKDHDTRRKISREWMALPKDSDKPRNKLWYSLKRQRAECRRSAPTVAIPR